MSGQRVAVHPDGTIIVDRGRIVRGNDVVFLDGLVEAIARLSAARIRVAGASHRAGVADGCFEVDDVEQSAADVVSEVF